MDSSQEGQRHSVIAVDSLRRVPSFEPGASTTTESSRPDLSNPALFSKPFQAYSPSIKFTYYSTVTDIRQAWSLDALAQPGEDPSVLFGGEEGGAFWIDVVAPNVEDLSRLGSTFGVHPLSTEDIQMNDSREKCEVFERYLFLCIQTCNQKFSNEGGNGSPTRRSEDLSPTSTLYILIFPRYIISLHQQPIPHIRRVLRRLYGLKTSQLDLSADWVMYSLFDDTVDEFMPQMQSLELEVDTIDELVLFLTHTEQSDMLRRIGRARKRVTHLQRLLKPKIEILKVLTKRSPDFLRDHTLIYMRDVNDHVLTHLQNLEQYNETLNRSHSNYLAQINIELSEASNRMNIVMKKLTAAAALVLPLSLISGIWGMNVPVPGQIDIDGYASLIPFTVIVTSMVIIMAIMFYIGRRHDWW